MRAAKGIACLFLGMGGLAPGAARGDKPGAAGGDAGCTNARTTMEMSACSAKALQKAEAELDAVYQRLRGRLASEAHRATLAAAEQAWLKFREEQCEFQAFLSRGGTIHGVDLRGCQTALTKDRARQLQRSIAELDVR